MTTNEVQKKSPSDLRKSVTATISRGAITIISRGQVVSKRSINLFFSLRSVVYAYVSSNAL